MRDARVLLPSTGEVAQIVSIDAEMVRSVYRAVVAWMNIDASAVRLEVIERDGADYRELSLQLPVSEFSDSSPHGTYEGGRDPVIRVYPYSFRTSASLIATLAHELTHHVLLDQCGYRGTDFDHEPLTDLAMVFLGMGCMGAHAAIYERTGDFGGWESQKSGYLPLQLWGYGSAVFAWYRKETDPDWAAEFPGTARRALRQGLRYLKRQARDGFDPFAD